LADLDDSTPECAQVSVLHTEPHFEALRKKEMVAVHCTNETTPIFWVFNSPFSRPQWPMDPRGGRGMSANIVPIKIKFGVDPSTCCWDIAQKPPKCKYSPLTPIVTKFHFPLHPPAGGRQPPKRENTHLEPEYSRMQNLAWIGPRVVEKSLTKKRTNGKKTYSKTNTSTGNNVEHRPTLNSYNPWDYIAAQGTGKFLIPNTQWLQQRSRRWRSHATTIAPIRKGRICRRVIVDYFCVHCGRMASVPILRW